MYVHSKLNSFSESIQQVTKGVKIRFGNIMNLSANRGHASFGRIVTASEWKWRANRILN